MINSILKVELLQNKDYRVSINIGHWEVSKVVKEYELDKIVKEINAATGLSKISEAFNCNGIDAKSIKDFWDSRTNFKLCGNCKFKWSACHDCVVKCQSPLERDLYLELRNNNILPILQRRINKDGTYYDYPKELNFDSLLTVPDFFIENESSKLCIYADGHTYHERTENQALRDRNIDRELQKLGFKVLRYTGKEIRSDCSGVVENIRINMV